MRERVANKKLNSNNKVKQIQNKTKIQFYKKKKWIKQSVATVVLIARSKDTDSAIFANEFAGERLLEAVFAVRCHGEVKPENEQNIYNQIVNSQNSFFNKNNTFTCCNFVQALSKIAKITNNKPCRVFICGSLYMARDIFVLSKKLKWVEALAVDIL
jgi:folylpolyglutamate synthase/dihydropteroate synthase